MAAHRAHPVTWEHGTDPEDALLFDGCPRCDQQALNPLALDERKLRAAWDWMFHVERSDGYYRTVNERKLCIRLYETAVVMARLQGHRNPWKVLP